MTDIYVGKVLFVKAGESLSLQYHEQKDESWLIQSGPREDRARLGRRREARRGGRRPGRSVPLRPGTVHRITAVEDTTILEVSTPHLDDVVRLADSYGREGTSSP